MTISGIAESVVVDAPKSAVWSVLADFPNIANWTKSVKTSAQTSDASSGVGATRSCDLAPMGAVKERIVEWEPEHKLVIDIYETQKLPIKRSLTTFTVEAIDEATTKVTMAPEAEAGGGVFSSLVSKRLQKGLPKAARALLEDLKETAESQAKAAAQRSSASAL